MVKVEAIGNADDDDDQCLHFDFDFQNPFLRETFPGILRAKNWVLSEINFDLETFVQTLS